MKSKETVCAKKGCRQLKERCVPRLLPRILLFYFLKLSVMSAIVLGALDARQKMKYYEKVMHEALRKHKGGRFLAAWGKSVKVSQKRNLPGSWGQINHIRRGQAERDLHKAWAFDEARNTRDCEKWIWPDLEGVNYRWVARDEAGSEAQMWSSMSLLIIRRLKNYLTKMLPSHSY